MIRNFFFSSMTAFGLLALGACSDDGKTTATNVQTTEDNTTTDGPSTTTDDTTTDGTTTSPATTVEDPTTSTTTPPLTTTTEPDTSTTDPGTSTSPGTTGPDTTTEPDTSTTEPDTSTTGPDTTTGDPLDQCLEQVNPGDPCGVCACNECLEELQACNEDAGCTAIRECAQEAGCGGIDCLGPCGDIIQMNGGPFGPSGMKAQAIGTCVDMQCANDC